MRLFCSTLLPHHVYYNCEQPKADGARILSVPLWLLIMGDLSALANDIKNATGSDFFSCPTSTIHLAKEFLAVFNPNDFASLDICSDAEPENTNYQACREPVLRVYKAQMHFLRVLLQSVDSSDCHKVTIKTGPKFVVNGREAELATACQRGLCALAVLKTKKFKATDFVQLYCGDPTNASLQITNVFRAIKEDFPRVKGPISRLHTVSFDNLDIRSDLDDKQLQEFLSQWHKKRA